MDLEIEVEIERTIGGSQELEFADICGRREKKRNMEWNR
jgi:hypothetical protein